jgi:hypothetical protein
MRLQLLFLGRLNQAELNLAGGTRPRLQLENNIGGMKQIPWNTDSQKEIRVAERAPSQSNGDHENQTVFSFVHRPQQ